VTATLNYTISGRPGTPWVTLAHSLATDLRMWQPQLAALEPHFQVLRYDARGHGGSELGEPQFTMLDLADDVVALWDQLDIAHSHFIGLSMGGMTGIGVALEHPARIDRLVACDCRLDAPGFFRSMWDGRIAAVQTGGMAAIVDEVLDTWLVKETGATELARELIMTTGCEGYIACAKALKILDFKTSLRRLSCPVLFMVGEHDGIHPREMAELAELTPGASLVTLANAAHLSNLEQPAAFNIAVLNFLSDRTAATGDKP
jgi:3-oxoadipate enol-lactonase